MLALSLFQQWRLIPYLAAAYALEHFTKSIFMNFVEFQIGQITKDKSDRQVSQHEMYVCVLSLPSYHCSTLCLLCVAGRVRQGDPCSGLL